MEESPSPKTSSHPMWKLPTLDKSAGASTQWPALETSADTIQPGQNPKEPETILISWSFTKKSPQEYASDRVGKYAPYFKDNEILPIPELAEVVEPRTLSFVVTDLKRGLRRGFKIRRHPMLVFLPAKFYPMRCLAPFGGPRQKAGNQQCHHKIL